MLVLLGVSLLCSRQSVKYVRGYQFRIDLPLCSSSVLSNELGLLIHITPYFLSIFLRNK